MIDLGFVKPGSTVRIPFGSYTGSTGASSAASNLADADIQVYKDGGTTQRASASGMVATTSYDSITGINLISIDLADNTTAGFWSAGSEYVVVINPFTIDSQTVALSLARFVIGLDAAVLNTTIATLSSQTSFTLTLGPAEDDALNGCVVYIHDVASAVQGGFAVVNDYTGSTKTVTLTAGVTFTAAATDNVSIFPPSNERWVGTQLASAAATVTYPATLASTTNITAGTFTTVTTATNVTTVNGLAANVITAAATAADFGTEIGTAVWANGTKTLTSLSGLTVDTVTTLTNLPTIPANWLTAAGTAADFGTEIGTAVWATGTRALTTLAGLTVDTVTTLTNLPSIPANWLTAAGTAADFIVEIQTGLSTLTAAQVNAEVDTAITDVGLTTTITGRIDADVSSRMATYTQPTGFLAATFPTDPADQSLVIAATDAILTRIGVAGAGLTALGDTRIANLDAAISTRMATFTLPTNFAAFSITAGGLVTLSPTANVFNGITPDAAFFTNAAAGSGLTAQQTRDAMKLAPSVGAAASGSIDDQLADIQTSVDALSAGSGTGAFIVTVTVTDGTDPLQNAKIRLIEGVTPYTATTNASGVATFSLDAATYSIAITKVGYQFTPSTIVVTAAGNFDKAMTPRVITPSANPDVCRVGAWVQTNSGLPLVGVFMFAKRTGTDPASAGALIESAEVTSILPSDDDGFVFIDLILPSEITPAALEYTIRIPAVNYNKPVTPTGATFEIELP